MYMENANIVLIEDKEQIRSLVHRWLDKSDHVITHEADSLDKAIQAVEDVASGELACDVVILDGNLEALKGNNEDARIVVDRIRERNLDVKIVGFASLPLSLSGIEVAANCDKSLLSELPGIIDKL